MKQKKRVPRGLVIVLVGLLALILLPRILGSGRGSSVDETGDASGKRPSVAVVHPIVRDFDRYILCDGEIITADEYVIRSSLGQVVETVHVDVGESVTPGTPLLEFRADDIEAEVTAAEAAHEEAQRNLRRYTALLAQGGVSENVVEARRTALEAAAAQLEAARSRLAFARIVAPDTEVPEGALRVAARTIEPGEHASPGNELLRLVDLSRLEIRARAPETAVDEIATGAELRFRLREPHPTWRDAEIGRISPATADADRFFDVFAPVENERRGEDWLMRPGMYVEVEILAEAVDGAIAVRAGTIARRAGTEVVFSLVDSPEGEMLARAIEVETGLRAGGFVQIVRPALTVRDRLVSMPLYDLQDGDPVRVVDAPK